MQLSVRRGSAEGPAAHFSRAHAAAAGWGSQAGGAHLRRDAHIPAVQQRHSALLQQAQQVADALPLVCAQAAAPVQAACQVVAWRGNVARAWVGRSTCATDTLAIASSNLPPWKAQEGFY